MRQKQTEFYQDQILSNSTLNLQTKLIFSRFEQELTLAFTSGNGQTYLKSGGGPAGIWRVKEIIEKVVWRVSLVCLEVVKRV